MIAQKLRLQSFPVRLQSFLVLSIDFSERVVYKRSRTGDVKNDRHLFMGKSCR